jgi:hypothetical protein
MATMQHSNRRSAITIPADYLEDVRSAIIEEVTQDIGAVRSDHEEVLEAIGEDRTANRRSDRVAAVRILREDMRLLDDLVDADCDTTVSGSRDAIGHVLQATVRVLSSRLADVCVYAPIDTAAVLELTGRLRWAAEETARVESDDSEAVA